MRCCFSSLQSSLRDYDKIQSAAVFLIYFQIGCALVGSLGAMYNGILLINLVVPLFALVAIKNNSQSLGRTYAALLASAIVLDIIWFILFSRAIWNISSEKYGPFFIFSVRLALGMQIIGFSVRLLSSLLWIQMYRLGASSMDSTVHRYANFDLRDSFLSTSSQVVVRQTSSSDDTSGGYMHDSAYYSSLFEDAKDERCGWRDERTART